MCNSAFNPLFKICTITENKVYTEAVNSILMKQVIVSIIAIIIALILIRFSISRNLSPLAAIQTGLTSFFDFINHKTKNDLKKIKFGLKQKLLAFVYQLFCDSGNLKFFICRNDKNLYLRIGSTNHSFTACFFVV